ncbi:TRAP transporter small permease [Lonepinella koalarum]|uniref:TRAP transporter small permease n=1 Tax=Lonepinella koalarum TaxID=53417 RepID=UPI003F6E3C12
MNNNIVYYFKKVQDAMATLSGIALLFMVLVIFLQTFTRFVIFYSLPWSEELSRYLFVVMILLGFNVAISKGDLIRIDIIDNYLKGNAKIVVQYVRILCAIFVNIIYIYSSFYLVKLGSYQLSPAMQIPMYSIYLVILLGFSLSLIALIVETFSISNITSTEEK